MKQKRLTISVPVVQKMSERQVEKLRKRWEKERVILGWWYGALLVVLGMLLGVCLSGAVWAVPEADGGSSFTGAEVGVEVTEIRPLLEAVMAGGQALDEEDGLRPEEIMALSCARSVPVDKPQTVNRWGVPMTEGELGVMLEVCEAERITPAVALALIEEESSFRPEAVNPGSGCYGYCQLNPEYFPSGLTPEENIRVGLGYLGEKLRVYEELEAALTAYHAGYDTGDRSYAGRVLAKVEKYEER